MGKKAAASELEPLRTPEKNIMNILGGVKRKAAEVDVAAALPKDTAKVPTQDPKPKAKSTAVAKAPAVAKASAEAKSAAKAKAAAKKDSKVESPPTQEPDCPAVKRNKATALLESPGDGGATGQGTATPAAASESSVLEIPEQVAKPVPIPKTKVRAQPKIKAEAEETHDEGIRVPFAELTHNQKMKFRAQFYRSCECGDVRTENDTKRRKGRAEKAPEWVVLQMQADTSSKDSWFRRWYEAKTWKTVMLQEEYVKEEERQKGKVFAWVTEAQLADHYKDENVASCIAQKKKRMIGAHKVHPEVPELKEAMLLKCWFSEQEAEILREKHIQTSRAEVELDDEAAEAHMHHASQSWAPTADAPPSVSDEPFRHQPSTAVTEEEMKKKADEQKEAEKKKEQAAAEAQEAEKQKKEDEAQANEAAAKAKKAAEKAAKAEADRSDPAKQADKMLNVIMAFLGQLAVQHEILDGATKFDDAVKASYNAKFQSSKDGLKTLRSDIEENLHTKNMTVVKAKLVEANTLNETLKSDLASFRVLHRTLYPKPKVPKADAGNS